MIEEPAALDLGIAAQDLQDPLDDPMGFGAPAGGLAMDGMADDLSDLGAELGADLGADLGGGLGGDLGGDLGADLAAAPMGEFAGLGDGMDPFNPDDAAAEISKLAGLEGDAVPGL